MAPVAKGKERSTSLRPPTRTGRPKASRRTSSNVRRTEIIINVYDLLPPGRLASTLWFFGSSLLHTGVVIKSLNREYAFGGHDRPGLSGVYWTKPLTEPPGGTFRCELLQGFTFRPEHEVESIIKDVSAQFLGPSYNLLSNNCNHFTSHLCEKLVGRPAPGWLNRAASIGVALPCVVPREWIAPPDHETADGELLEEEEDERTSMLRQEYHRGSSFRGNEVGEEEAEEEEQEQEQEGWSSDRDRRKGGSGKGKSAVRDTAGRDIPASERAPPPRER